MTEKRLISNINMQETCSRCKDPERLNVKKWKKIFHENGNQKKAGVLIAYKADFKTDYNKRKWFVT